MAELGPRAAFDPENASAALTAELMMNGSASVKIPGSAGALLRTAL
jgi:hypothetical protein